MPTDESSAVYIIKPRPTSDGSYFGLRRSPASIVLRTLPLTPVKLMLFGGGVFFTSLSNVRFADISGSVDTAPEKELWSLQVRVGTC